MSVSKVGGRCDAGRRAVAAGRLRVSQGTSAGVPVATDAVRRVWGTIEKLAQRERVNRCYMSRVLRLALLAPDIIEQFSRGVRG